MGNLIFLGVVKACNLYETNRWLFESKTDFIVVVNAKNGVNNNKVVEIGLSVDPFIWSLMVFHW